MSATGKEIHGIVLDSGKEPVHEFLNDLDQPDQQEFYAGFGKVLAGQGWTQMGQWFKPLRHVSNVWQIASTNCRILGFRHVERLVLTNGFGKKRADTPQEEIDRSLRLQEAFKSVAR